MATTNSSPGRKKPVNIVCTFQTQVKNDKAVSQGRINAATGMTESQETMRAYKLCCLKMGEKTFRFYRDIDNYELFDMTKSCEIILTNVNGYSQKNADLGKIIKDASKMLGDLKTKLHDANNAACAMQNCLKNIIGFKDNAIPDKISAIVNSAKSLSEDGKSAAEAIVDIAGIQTFSNIDNLKTYAQKVSDSMKALKVLGDRNIAQSIDENKAIQTDLTKVIEELNKTQFESADATCTLNGQEKTLTFICEGECRPISFVEEICKNITSEIEGKPPLSTTPTAWKADDRD